MNCCCCVLVVLLLLASGTGPSNGSPSPYTRVKNARTKPASKKYKITPKKFKIVASHTQLVLGDVYEHEGMRTCTINSPVLKTMSTLAKTMFVRLSYCGQVVAAIFHVWVGGVGRGWESGS